MRVWRVVVAASVLVLGVGTARASTDPYHDQADAKVPCPAAPTGWAHPPDSTGSRFVLTPLTVIQNGTRQVAFGAPIVQINCEYVAGGGTKNLEVMVRYALPIDLNPWNDFYVGCTALGRPQPPSTAARPWHSSDGVYRVVGSKTWSLATFIDDLKALGTSDVPRFEKVADTMLTDAQPLAHNCGLAGNGKPVDLQTIWSFAFAATTSSGGVVSTGKSSGTFLTASVPGTSTGTISKLVAADFRLTLTSKGKKQYLAIHVGEPLGFSHSYGAQLRAQVVVVGSNDARCRSGSTGTLELSVQALTVPVVKLQVCGGTYLDGKGLVTATMHST